MPPIDKSKSKSKLAQSLSRNLGNSKRALPGKPKDLPVMPKTEISEENTERAVAAMHGTSMVPPAKAKKDKAQYVRMSVDLKKEGFEIFEEYLMRIKRHRNKMEYMAELIYATIAERDSELAYRLKELGLIS